MLNSERFAWILFVLRKIGVTKLVHIICDCMDRKNPTEEMLQYRKMKDLYGKELKSVYQMLEDKKSKAVYADIFKYRCSKERKYLKPHIDSDIYFNEITMPDAAKHEVFVDGGAFNGDTIKLFVKKTNYIFEHIFAFETESDNIKKLNSYLDKKSMKEKVTVFPYALWNEKKELYLSNDIGMNQKVVASGDITIDANTIDNLLSDVHITFIKMDIEGAELEALQGAKDVIQKCKPKLAISIYHKPEDYFKIALYIKELVPEYKLYVRHYTCFFADTVLYAIP